MTKFCVTCPTCHGTGGGLAGITIGLDAAGMAKQMEENAKRRCSTCEGRGTIWVQQCSPPEQTTATDQAPALTTLIKQEPVKEYKAACGCVVRLLPSQPPMSNLTTSTICAMHQPNNMQREREKIYDEAIAHLNSPFPLPMGPSADGWDMW